MSDRFEQPFSQQFEENESFLARLAGGKLSRRNLLIGSGAASLALVAAACGDDDEEPASSGSPTTERDSTTTTEGGGNAAGDLAVAQTAAGLEVLAVGTYGAALEAAQGGALGTVPPAVAEYVTTAQAHHQAHLDAWNEVITGAGEDEVTDPPADLKATVDEQFAAVTDVAGAAELALMLEQIAADTYLAVIPTLEGEDAIKLASTIQPIDMQHSAVLRYVLGQYPVPNVFANTDNAYSG